MAPHPTISIPKINNSPASLTPEIRSALLTALMAASAIPEIRTALLSSCQSTGWLDAVRERALQLLRSGECRSYRDLMDMLKEEVRAPPERTQGDEGEGGGGGQTEEEDNDAWERDKIRKRRRRNGGNGGGEEVEREIDLRIPAKAYNDGVRAVREALETVVEVAD